LGRQKQHYDSVIGKVIPMLYRKAQSTLEVSLVIAVIVGAALIMQAYVKRGIQGRIQLAGDQLAEQYAIGETKMRGHFDSKISITEWMFPGPVNTSRSHGTFSSHSTRELEPLPVK